MKNVQRIINKTLALIVLLAIFWAPPLLAQSGATNASKNAKEVAVNSFTVSVPSNWQSFNSNQSDQLRRQYLAQSAEIYRQYSGVADQSKSVDIAAFHIAGGAGSFVLVSFAIPPQSDLINLLKNQAEEKAKWGIRQGYIQKYLGLLPIEKKKFSGFYVKFLGSRGEVQISGGLENKNFKGNMVQLTLISPKSWDELRATNIINSILDSLELTTK